MRKHEVLVCGCAARKRRDVQEISRLLCSSSSKNYLGSELADDDASGLDGLPTVNFDAAALQ